MRLALALGRGSVRELLQSLTSAELTEWIAFGKIEPFGEPMANWRAGLVASVFANVHRRKRTKAFKPEDFMPAEDRASQSWQDQLAHVQAIAARGLGVLTNGTKTGA